MDMLGAALSGNLDDIEKVIRLIKEAHSEQKPDLKEQTLVLVSTVMTWINTPKKIRKEGSEGTTDDDNSVLHFTD